MAIRPSAALLAGLLAAPPALAQLSPPACRLLVPRNETVLQPLRIHPAQVAQKNSLGCLSAADAFYGPDGCPSQLCGQKHGYKVPMPPLSGR
jgi:hypothetical protein